MLNTFNDEFENGKLYVSYPMVESLRHLKDNINFKDIAVISQPEYKKVSKQCNKEYLNFNNYTKDIWNKLIIQHCKKANYIVNDDFNIPNDHIEQLEILTNQKIKYIDIDSKVAVLSAFPIFLAYYYGYNILQEKIK
jgi:catalase (peroxidase I)